METLSLNIDYDLDANKRPATTWPELIRTLMIPKPCSWSLICDERQEAVVSNIIDLKNNIISYLQVIKSRVQSANT
jgi:hypothetical protein